jgi:hypothetical protein
MRRTLALTRAFAVTLALMLTATASSAQEPPPVPNGPPIKAQLVLTLRGAQRSLTDSVRGVLLEHDHTQWDLLITGAKGRSQFTCELRSADRAVLFDIQRAILAAPELVVNCANGPPSTRGGVLINLDDPNGGSFVLEARKP